MLRENQLFGTVDLVQTAIARIRQFERAALDLNQDGYWVAFSGGKDSIVVLDLVRKAGVRHTAHFNLTTVDPPELLQFIRKHYPDVIRDRPTKSMWDLIVERRMPPTRKVRYCCQELKERGGAGHMVVTGVRWAESVKRSKRRMVESCFRDKSKWYLNPIVDWSDKEVWQYIRENNLPYCSLYDQGFKRVGCVMCPMAERRRHLDAIRWPGFKRSYIRAFDRMLESRKRDGLPTAWETGEQVYDWWMKEPRRTAEKDSDQGVLFE